MLGLAKFHAARVCAAELGWVSAPPAAGGELGVTVLAGSCCAGLQGGVLGSGSWSRPELWNPWPEKSTFPAGLSTAQLHKLQLG